MIIPVQEGTEKSFGYALKYKMAPGSSLEGPPFAQHGAHWVNLDPNGDRYHYQSTVIKFVDRLTDGAFKFRTLKAYDDHLRTDHWDDNEGIHVAGDTGAERTWNLNQYARAMTTVQYVPTMDIATRTRRNAEQAFFYNSGRLPVPLAMFDKSERLGEVELQGYDLSQKIRSCLAAFVTSYMESAEDQMVNYYLFLITTVNYHNSEGTGS